MEPVTYNVKLPGNVLWDGPLPESEVRRSVERAAVSLTSERVGYDIGDPFDVDLSAPADGTVGEWTVALVWRESAERDREASVEVAVEVAVDAAWTVDDARAAYPPSDWHDDKDHPDASGYGPLVTSFGEVVVQVDDQDYQGDTRVLLRHGQRYGVLLFGWGSCSGCDALQACDSYQELLDLRERLRTSIVWHDSAADCAAYMRAKDWQLDRCWHEEGTERFVREALAALDGAS